MTSLLKTAALLTVVSTGLVTFSSAPAHAIAVGPFGPIAPVVTAPTAVEVPEPSAIAPLALVGVALILRRRAVQPDDV